MKLKLSLDKNAIQTFLLENVEKIVFGGFVVLFLLIIYGAIRRDSYPKKPENLVTSAGNAEQHWQQTSEGEKTPVVDYPSIARSSQTAIKEEAYHFSVPWSAPLFEQTNVRKKPELYAVEELRGFFDRGAVAGDAGGAGGATRGQRFVVLTGVVPKKRQGEAFKQALGDTLVSATKEDLIPVYHSFVVERAEVVGRKDPDESAWEDVTPESEKADQVRSSATDALAQELIDPAIAEPLPQLVGNKALDVSKIYHDRLTGTALDTVIQNIQNLDKYKGKKAAWQGEVNNPDGTKLLVFRASVADAPDAEPMYFAVEYGTQAERDAAAQSGQGGSIPGIVMGKVPVKVSTKDEAGNTSTQPKTVPLLKFDPTAQPFGAPGGEGLGSMPGDFRRGERLLAEASSSRGAEGRVELPEYVLFRFFDYNVEPGKQYRYRVRVVLNNPNYKVDAHFLESPELAEDETLETPLTGLDRVITVPRDVCLLASSVTPPTETRLPSGVAVRIGDTTRNVPSGKMMVVQWEEANGLEAFKEFSGKECLRGSVPDFPNCTFPEDEGSKKPTVKTPKSKTGEGEEPAAKPAKGKRGEGEELPGKASKGKSRDPDEPPIAYPSGRDTSTPTETFSVSYTTGAVILDLNGGTPIPGKDRSLTSPGEILVLDADGSLRVHRELDDLAEYQRRKSPAGAAPPKQRPVASSTKGSAAGGLDTAHFH